MNITDQVAELRVAVDGLKAEVGKVIVGQEDVVEGVIVSLIAGGHCLLEGVPGLGKTRLVRTVAQALDLEFSRIQFTPDLMPTDITGTRVAIQDDAGHTVLDFQRGPIFASVVLADEINRATPRTQSAMLEAMQERSVTVGTRTHALPEPFFVLATQNPLEMDGTYPLPEAQLDRFLFKLHVTSPGADDLHTILDRTTGWEAPTIAPVMGRDGVMGLRRLALQVPVARHVQDVAVRVVLGTHPHNAAAPELVKRYVRVGASPRGAQAIVVAAKVRAVMDGRFAVSEEDVLAVVRPALRHRIIRNFEGEAEDISPDLILQEVMALATGSKRR